MCHGILKWKEKLNITENDTSLVFAFTLLYSFYFGQYFPLTLLNLLSHPFLSHCASEDGHHGPNQQVPLPSDSQLDQPTGCTGQKFRKVSRVRSGSRVTTCWLKATASAKCPFYTTMLSRLLSLLPPLFLEAEGW